MTLNPVPFSTSEWADMLGVPPPASWPSDCNGVQADSRLIRPGDLFVAISGHATDGHAHIQEAIQRGAAAVVMEKDRSGMLSVPSVKVPSGRKALALISKAFFKSADEELTMIGVTGTNGKTSVTRFVQHFLEADKHTTGSLGTVGVSFAGRILPARRTTPGGPDLHRILREMRRAGCERCVMEVSSHALDQDRVHGLAYDIVVFTNLSQDHLDYHDTMERYFETKCSLFAMPGITTRIVGDDEWSDRLAQLYGPEVIRCGCSEGCQVRATHIESTLAGTVAEVSTPWGQGTLRMPLPGIYNLRNALQAIAAAVCAGADLKTVLDAAETLEAAPGRMQLIPGNTGRVYVDYAHTPDALGKVLSLLKQLARGRVKVVFGCGGDRDRRKRPLMVEEAATYADDMVFTLDNPRSEDPGQIFADMKEGLTPGVEAEIQPDRAEAIRSAIMGLEMGDVLLIAGKGHESIQEIGSVQVPFNDRDVAAACIRERDQTSTGAAGHA